MASSHPCRISPTTVVRTKRWDDFTHLWVGQAERLACRERQPTRFPGRSPDPLCGQGPKTERRKAALSITGIAMLLTKRNHLASNGVRTNTRTAPVWPCAPLCASITGGAESLPLPDKPRPTWAVVPGRFGPGVFSLPAPFRRTKNIAG